MASQVITRKRRQIRSFVLVWTGITLLMGACTFVGIYAAYGLFEDQINPGGVSSAALPQLTGSPQRVVEVATSTPLPTPVPTPLRASGAGEGDDGEMDAADGDPMANADEMMADSAGDDESGDDAPEVAQAEPEPTEVPPTPTPRPVDVDEFEVGIQVQVSYDLQAMWMDVVNDQLGLEWVKMQVRWEDIEREEDNYDWSPLDVYIPEASDRGVKVLISVVTAPDWAREEGVNLEQHGPPADNADYAEFVTKILERYPGEIHAVEVWNEMNLDREWTSARGLSAEAYVELLATTRDAIKAVDPGVIVVSGALSPTGFSDGVTAWDDAVYFDQLIAAGMLDYTDCVGAHHNGYNISPIYTYDNVPNDPSAQFRGPFDNPHRSWSFRSTLQTYSNKIALAGGDQKLCVTEFGWPSAEGLDGVPVGFEFAADNSLEEQQQFTIQALEYMSEDDTVRLAFLWNLNYGPQAGWDPNNDNVPYSIIGPGTQFRPVFDALRDWQAEWES